MFSIFPGLLHSRRDSSLGARLRDSERLSSLFFERSQLGSSPTWLFYDYHLCKYLTARLPQVFKCRKFSISSLFLRGFRATATGCRKFQVFQLVLSLLFSRQLSHVCRIAPFTASDFEHIFRAHFERASTHRAMRKHHLSHPPIHRPFALKKRKIP